MKVNEMTTAATPEEMRQYENNRMHARMISVRLRFPVVEVSPGKFEVVLAVPMGADGMASLNKAFIAGYHLSEAEIDKAEAAVLRAIAVIE